MTGSDRSGALDLLAAALATRAGVRFVVAATDAERAAAYRLRRAAVTEKRWQDTPQAAADGEQDTFDPAAVQVIGYRDDEAVCCGRLVLPPGPLPTETVCGITVEPAGRVVDVGRMVVAPAARSQGGGVFLALLAALYLETRARGYTAGCGMMAPNVRVLLRGLGIAHDVLGPDRPYLGEPRAPVRFDVAAHGPDVLHSWT